MAANMDLTLSLICLNHCPQGRGNLDPYQQADQTKALDQIACEGIAPAVLRQRLRSCQELYADLHRDGV